MRNYFKMCYHLDCNLGDLEYVKLLTQNFAKVFAENNAS